MIRALLIEDTAAARADLRNQLKAHPEVEIVGEADSVSDAKPLLQTGDYELVFMDIQLRGGNAFSLVPLVRAEARIIFVTAYNEYAVRAFAVNALDYLLKPVSAQRLAHSLARLSRSPSETAPPFPNALIDTDLVCLSTDEGRHLAPVAAITLVEAEQNYTAVWLTSGQRRLVRRPLKEWEQNLVASHFVRIGRDALLNLKHVAKVERLGVRGANVWVVGRQDPARISFRYWPMVRASVGRDPAA